MANTTPDARPRVCMTLAELEARQLEARAVIEATKRHRERQPKFDYSITRKLGHRFLMLAAVQAWWLLCQLHGTNDHRAISIAVAGRKFRLLRSKGSAVISGSWMVFWLMRVANYKPRPLSEGPYRNLHFSSSAQRRVLADLLTLPEPIEWTPLSKAAMEEICHLSDSLSVPESPDVSSPQ